MLFNWCMVNETLEEGRARVAVQQVLQSKRRGYFTVLSEFQRAAKLQEARQTAKIDSAVIGGIRIQVSNDVYDGSVKSRLATLAAKCGIRSA
jgi:F0F1-type ATP synthase delta subunit